MKHSADDPVMYEFRVSGRLEPRWAAHFEGLTLTPDTDGTTSLRGEVADQAALHGILQRLRDAGLSLVCLTQIARRPDGRIRPPAAAGLASGEEDR